MNGIRDNYKSNCKTIIMLINKKKCCYESAVYFNVQECTVITKSYYLYNIVKAVDFMRKIKDYILY